MNTINISCPSFRHTRLVADLIKTLLRDQGEEFEHSQKSDKDSITFNGTIYNFVPLNKIHEL